MRTTTLFLAIELRADASESRIREAVFADLARQFALNRRVPIATTEDHQPVYVIDTHVANDEIPPREHNGFDLLIGKLSMEPIAGVKPLLPEPRFGQDVALLAHTIDSLRARLEGRSADAIRLNDGWEPLDQNGECVFCDEQALRTSEHHHLCPWRIVAERMEKR